MPPTITALIAPSDATAPIAIEIVDDTLTTITTTKVVALCAERRSNPATNDARSAKKITTATISRLIEVGIGWLSKGQWRHPVRVAQLPGPPGEAHVGQLFGEPGQSKEAGKKGAGVLRPRQSSSGQQRTQQRRLPHECGERERRLEPSFGLEPLLRRLLCRRQLCRQHHPYLPQAG